MIKDERNNFLAWYKLEKEKTFNCENELIKYCNQDFQVLRHAFIKCMKKFEITTNVNPFLDSISIATACNVFIRRNYLKTDSINSYDSLPMD